MSKMAEVMIDIEECLADGLPAVEIADKLKVPISWVFGVEQELMYGPRAYGNDYDGE